MNKKEIRKCVNSLKKQKEYCKMSKKIKVNGKFVINNEYNKQLKEFEEKVRNTNTIEELLNAPEIIGTETILHKGKRIEWNQFIASENVLTGDWLVENRLRSPVEDFFITTKSDVKRMFKFVKTYPKHVQELTEYFNKVHKIKEK